MTKKDYILIAGAFKRANESNNFEGENRIIDQKQYENRKLGMAIVRNYMMSELWHKDEKFNEKKFQEACGIN